MKSMMEMMKRCLSLGFSLPVVALAGMRRNYAPSQSYSPALQKTPPSTPSPFPTPVSPSEVPAKAPVASSYSGTVVRDGGRFALRETDGTLFALDSTGRAWPFEGEEVLITGYFDFDSRLLHICAIEGVDDLRAEAV
jgi:hypothetical protein